MKLLPTILALVFSCVAVADETLYRYEGDVHPLDPSAGWEEFNPCEPPCSEFLEDGHFVRLWPEWGEFASYHYWIAEPPESPPESLWIEWRFRSNFPLGPIFTGCDAALNLKYKEVSDLVDLTGDSVITYDNASFVLGLNMYEFHTYRFQSVDGLHYSWSVDGDRFAIRIDNNTDNGYSYLQMYGDGGCGSDRVPNQKNEWDYVRYGTIGHGEQIEATDPPAGPLSPAALASLDTFTVTFDSPNYVYLDEITVTSTSGTPPQVIAVRRHEGGEPDTVEFVLDQPPPLHAITRFILNDGEAVNIIEYSDTSIVIGAGACCLGDGTCQNLSEDACLLLEGALYRGAGTGCLGHQQGGSADDACDDLFDVPAVSTWGVLVLTLLVLTTGTMIIRRPALRMKIA